VHRFHFGSVSDGGRMPNSVPRGSMSDCPERMATSRARSAGARFATKVASGSVFGSTSLLEQRGVQQEELADVTLCRVSVTTHDFLSGGLEVVGSNPAAPTTYDDSMVTVGHGMSSR
jgi:hypothetical protein